MSTALTTPDAPVTLTMTRRRPVSRFIGMVRPKACSRKPETAQARNEPQRFREDHPLSTSPSCGQSSARYSRNQ